MKNIVFYFSGTGNNLKIAKELSNELEECEIKAIGKNKNYDLEGGYDYIGFVFPVYFLGLPLIVSEFITKLNLEKNKNAYIFAIASCGGSSGIALSQVTSMLKEKNTDLDYGANIQMFSNYVNMYNMSEKVKEKTDKSNEDIQRIVNDISKKVKINKSKNNLFLEKYYKSQIKKVNEKDKYYSVSSDCISCGICEKVCPVNNISMDINKKPTFNHHCEQCVACIQHCPKKAINYKNKTQKRRRYIHPEIDSKMLSEYNNI